MTNADIIAKVEAELTRAGFAKATARQTGFVVMEKGRRVEVHVRVGGGGQPTEELNRIVGRYYETLEEVKGLEAIAEGNLTKYVVVSEGEPEPVLTPVRYELHEERGLYGLRVKVGGEIVGTIAQVEGEDHWIFEHDPSHGRYANRETAARAVLLVRQLDQVLKYHVDEEDVYENAIQTALAALQSSPAVDGKGRVKIFKH